jgi:hypothetical protein
MPGQDRFSHCSGFLRIDPLFASGEFPDPRSYDQDLSPYQGSLKDGDRCRQVFETFKGWRFKALAIGVPAVTRENEETLRLPDFIKDFTSYCNFSLPNRLMEHITLACQGVGSVVPLKPLMA